MISSETIIRIAIALLGVAFGAGGAAFSMRQTRRDLNGLGRKSNRIIALLVKWADTEEKRAQVVRLIEPQDKSHG